jgi:hypothetical protein
MAAGTWSANPSLPHAERSRSRTQSVTAANVVAPARTAHGHREHAHQRVALAPRIARGKHRREGHQQTVMFTVGDCGWSGCLG